LAIGVGWLSVRVESYVSFQLIVDYRVADRAKSLDEAVNKAALLLSQPVKPSIQILNLAGGVYGDSEVSRLVDIRQNRN